MYHNSLIFWLICMKFDRWVHSEGVDTHVYLEDSTLLIFGHMAKNSFLVFLWKKLKWVESWMIPLFLGFLGQGLWFWYYFSDLRLHFGHIAKKMFYFYFSDFYINNSNGYSWMIPLFLGFWGQWMWFWCYFNDLRSNLGHIAFYFFIFLAIFM